VTQELDCCYPVNCCYPVLFVFVFSRKWFGINEIQHNIPQVGNSSSKCLWAGTYPRAANKTQHWSLPNLSTKERSAQSQWRPPNRAGKTLYVQGVLQAEHIDIVKRDALLTMQFGVNALKTTALAQDHTSPKNMPKFSCLLKSQTIQFSLRFLQTTLESIWTMSIDLISRTNYTDLQFGMFVCAETSPLEGQRPILVLMRWWLLLLSLLEK